MTIVNKRNYTLDVIKFIASLAVVFIHFPLPDNIGTYTKALARFAVPVFFISAGYFCYGNDGKKIIKKLKHILLIFAIAFLIYFVFGCANNILEQRSLKGVVEYIKHFLNGKVAFQFWVYNYVTVISGHLWFLPALIYCYVIQFFVVKSKLNSRALFVIATALMLINLCAGEFGKITGLSTDFYKIRNFLFFGYPIFIYGMLIKKHTEALLKYFGLAKIIILIAVGAVEIIVSTHFFGMFDMYIGSAIIAFSLFVFALKKHDVQYGKTVIAVAECSTEIYVLHIIVWSVTRNVLLIMGIHISETVISVFKPFYVCIASVIIALIWKTIKQYVVTHFSRNDIQSSAV